VGVDEGEAVSGELDDCRVGIALFSFPWRDDRHLGGVVVDQSSVSEVEVVLDEIGLTLLFVPDEHTLIVDERIKAVLKLPKFETEAEEAQWWFDHRDDLSDEFLRRAAEGTLGEVSVARALKRRQARVESEQALALNGSQAK
jgi:hypothetical protein